ncbi:MAG: dihydroorotate oxidase [Candidatus Levybacteria bacterium RIFCSPHIGHO2_12_FULL_38_12]|nr:MAG: dihydroorotate oxidase [Candidatus Levybacteria bacterium RIFCSPHIGHO2_01_FULL_38_12]OGH22433.1 MAG: dihydroorotate oxidase [Candidatus Levybacteria bacterium RIFCSPHIGHO2_02_FULL_37_18]OGH23398.1 MAG: dihydroorotate oxidase [Candidatus Levybacteria bacterium RIFCSPHIGHO2_12_FULL_38_12]OGH34907.1 MAG: dihydroorotate oxidase [Candidatus Levybacteria bacterium RIFCSPLOWO2_01_FULL_37_20]OGH43649.1 MAG: dihydroorotate oxidase [Candidatus Levybacteria bacterium RIFCSPLOWO2_02_FULL_37_18]OGH
MIDISTTIAGIKLDSCIFNASGPNDETLPQLEIIGKSKSPAITMKSCTIAFREGNPGPRYADLPANSSINSMGLPNLGYKEYIKFTKILKKKYEKPVVASICGMTLEDNVEMFKAFNNSDVDIIEFNPGSPNTIGKPIVGYNPIEMDRLLAAVSKICKKPWGVKLPPYFDFVHYEQIAKVLKQYPVKFVTSINSVGNGLVIDPEKEAPAIKPKGGFGGIGGRLIKNIALANVRKFYLLFEDKIQVIGVGGAATGIDVFEFILAGASAVQIATTFMQEGTPAFPRLQKELKDYMKKKGYKTIEDFRGKLRVE